MKSFNEFVNEGKTTFKRGQKVTIKNARKYDSMARVKLMV